jgi:hypothetical protein
MVNTSRGWEHMRVTSFHFQFEVSRSFVDKRVTYGKLDNLTLTKFLLYCCNGKDREMKHQGFLYRN